MTVKQLIEALQEELDDAEVMFAYEYGDYGRSVVAEKVRRVGADEVEWSEYHRSWKVIDDDEAGPGSKRVVVLR